MVVARQAVITEPFKAAVREVELADPGPNQVLIAAEYSAVSAGTELAVYTGTHQWLKDPNLPDWKFPFRSGYSAAGRVLKVGRDFPGNLREGDRVSFPGNHASAELLTVGHERCRVWKMPENLSFDKAAVACIARYGLGASVRAGLTLGRSAAVLGLGIIGQFALRCLLAAGASPVVGIDGVKMRRDAALAAGADHVIDQAGDVKSQLNEFLGTRGAEVVADATGVPDAIPVAMSLACDAGQVVVVGSPRGRAKEVNFYDDLHRRYIEVTGAHGNMLFEPAHTRLAGAWDINKAQMWLLRQLASGRLSLAGLVTHTITPEKLGDAYEGLLTDKDHYLGVLVKWV
ncbi:MAG: zinc-binding dehydrogenase [Gemmataceae bacterium]|nr:zinc-binding dehydrogenase [Gemmataceae bacterium]